MDSLNDFLGNSHSNYTEWKNVYNNAKSKEIILKAISHKVSADKVSNFNSFRKQVRPILQNLAEKLPNFDAKNTQLNKDVKLLFSQFPRPIIFLGEFQEKVNEYLK